MQVISYSKSKKKKLVEELLIKINKLDFHIVYREDQKNKNFMKKYRIIDKKGALKVLEKISFYNLQSIEYDNDVLKYGSEEVVILYVYCELIDFHGDLNNIKVYVKIKNKENNLPVISFHECEY